MQVDQRACSSKSPHIQGDLDPVATFSPILVDKKEGVPMVDSASNGLARRCMPLGQARVSRRRAVRSAAVLQSVSIAGHGK